MNTAAPGVLLDEAAILELRAERLRKRPAEADEAETFWVAEFPLGEERYAIPLERLRACIPLRRVRPVPLAKPFVIGVFAFDGQLISAVSLAARLGVRGFRRDPATLLVLELAAGQLVAIDAEAIPKPLALPRAAATAAPGDAPVLEIASGDRLIGLLVIDRLLGAAEEHRDS
jgi:purine-binding chemotaxis protein CheW